MFEKIEFSKEKPNVSGKYFTWNQVETLSGSKLEMSTTEFDLENNKIYNVNKVIYWLKPI